MYRVLAELPGDLFQLCHTGRIGGNRSYTVTVPAAPEIASSSTATGLGAIGIAVTGVPIFNDLEGDNRPIEEVIAETFAWSITIGIKLDCIICLV